MAKKIDSISRGRPSAPKERVVARVEKAEKERPVSSGHTEEFDKLFPEPTISISHPPAWVLWGILAVSIIVLLGIAFKVINGQLDSWLGIVPSSPTPTATVTAQATASESPSASPTNTPTTTPTATPTSTPGTTSVDKVTLRVLNGTTITGAAAKAASTLTKAGYNVRTTGNATRRTYTTTTIYYRSGYQAEAEAVQKALPTYRTAIELSAVAAPDMVLVVIGTK